MQLWLCEFGINKRIVLQLLLKQRRDNSIITYSLKLRAVFSFILKARKKEVNNDSVDGLTQLNMMKQKILEKSFGSQFKTGSCI